MKPFALVIGAGIGGLATALEIAKQHDVMICAPATGWRLGSTYRAQGGIAAAVGSDDDWRSHFEDTLSVSRGLADPEAVKILTREGPQAVRPLIKAELFAMEDGGIPALSREAGHSRPRILHAPGSLTGRAIARYFYEQTLQHARIQWVDGRAVKLILNASGHCQGSWVQVAPSEVIPVMAPVTVIATGGYAALWRPTTNTPLSTGHGLWLAYEAGAELWDLEFMQFHPTVLSEEAFGGDWLLLTEALRGFGAYLINDQGIRFMRDHPGQELAGRDEVARAVYRQPRAYLTLRHLQDTGVYEHFGKLADLVSQRGFDLAHDLLPVAPAAHFAMGGIATDLTGQTRVAGLYAVGEAANTGVHGANRLASNSLLEALVFARRIARHVQTIRPHVHGVPTSPPPQAESMPPADIVELLGAIMDECFGVLRDPQKMASGLRQLHALKQARPHWIWDFALLVGQSAAAREESRGSHYRLDYPHSDARWGGHCIHQKQQGFWFSQSNGQPSRNIIRVGRDSWGG